MTDLARPDLEGLGRYKFGWADSDVAGATAKRGLSEAVVREISGLKNEPEWMLDMRLKGLRLFEKKPMPHWGSDLSGIDFDNIKYFVRSTEKQAASWDDLPAALPETGLLVNTTSLGMKGQPPLAVDLSPLPADAAVADIVYAPLETALLAAARRRGLAAVDGLGMLLHQAVPGFEAWFGPRPAVTPELRDRIVADLAG